MSLKIAILDDEEVFRQNAVSALKRFSDEQHVHLEWNIFSDPILFLDKYKPGFDLLLIDIQMPHIDGMHVAEKIRETDAHIQIVFITVMASMAVHGYAVDAVDFIVKPIRYGSFESMMKKVLRRQMPQDESVIVKTPEGLTRISTNDILYMEVRDHRVLYHLPDRTIETWSSLRAERSKLPEVPFAQCSNEIIVHLKYVKNVTGTEVQLDSMALPLSRARKKAFTEQLIRYYGGR